jgi:hypothetical protein
VRDVPSQKASSKIVVRPFGILIETRAKASSQILVRPFGNTN